MMHNNKSSGKRTHNLRCLAACRVLPDDKRQSLKNRELLFFHIHEDVSALG